MKEIKKILIANRGEIACRVIKSCKLLAIESHSLYAADDKDLVHVELADFSHDLGNGTPTDTYLNQDKIIKIAKENGIDAIHPGYGFLSENSVFAQAVEKAGITFIGPRSDSIIVMGDKIQSKIKAGKLGVPLIPGYHGEDQDDKILEAEAKKIGYPVLIKASAGGGGKGMRIVHNEKDFAESLRGCRSEAMKSFSNDAVLIEKFLEKPRHIEVQVFGDGHGNAVHLFERECSWQRRYQKVIEESPSIAFNQEKRLEICETAAKLAAGLNYRGAGTVEFIYAPNGDFYFLEMNTRLQVEHPVTEMVTGLDLVKWQIDIAQSEKLPLEQKDITQTGFSIECRIYAEDPFNNFLPSSGKLHYLGESDQRVDTGYRPGNEVGINYDPMIAKLITHGEDRKFATLKMIKTLKEMSFLGVTTNREFLIKALESPEFETGDYHTNYIEQNIEKLTEREISFEDFAAAFELIQKNSVTQSQTNSMGGAKTSPWDLISGFYS